jgi:hypothetical protein
MTIPRRCGSCAGLRLCLGSSRALGPPARELGPRLLHQLRIRQLLPTSLSRVLLRTQSLEQAACCADFVVPKCDASSSLQFNGNHL